MEASPSHAGKIQVKSKADWVLGKITNLGEGKALKSKPLGALSERL